MKKILCLAVPALLVAACSDSADSPDAGPDAAELDAHGGQDGSGTSSAPDVRLDDDGPSVKLDIPAPDWPVINLDKPLIGDGPWPLIYPDLPPAADVAAIDRPAIETRTPDVPDRDLATMTLWFPDGRTATVVMVDSCDSGALWADPSCPATYADGLAKAMDVDGGVLPSYTAAGQCAEGSYVYMPYGGLETKSCYYGSDGMTLVAIKDCSDVTHECTAAPGAASNCWHHGPLPPCTDITWAVQRRGY